MKLKRMLLYCGGLLLVQQVSAQSTNGTFANNAYVAGYYLGWNASNGVNPLFTRTNNINRMRLNGNQSTNIQATGLVPRDGYLGLGTFNIPGGGNYWTTNSPATQLHLIGRNGNFIQDVGYRTWMQSGISFADNQDFAYVGMRQVGNGFDETEFAFNLADNSGSDDFVFRFTSGQSNAGVDNDFVSQNDLDGKHLARLTGEGYFGLGNTFGNQTVNPGFYNRPRSLFHVSYQYRAGAANEPFGFMQITYRRPQTATADSVGQGERATDGLRLGIDNDLFGVAGRRHLNSYLRWQEASSFIIQTEDDLTPNIQSNERMRITSADVHA